MCTSRETDLGVAELSSGVGAGLLNELPPPTATGLAGVPFYASPLHGPRGQSQVRIVLIHYSAGGTLESNVQEKLSPATPTSAHFFVGRQGEIVQMVPLDRAAQHAGPSWIEDVGLLVNRSSIGIEVVNAGYLHQQQDGRFQTDARDPYRGAPPVTAPDSLGRSQIWEPFGDQQYEALGRLLAVLFHEFPQITTVTGHEDVTIPLGRKSDPGGAFDWDRLRRLLPAFRGRVGRLPGGGPIKDAIQPNRAYAASLKWGERVPAIVSALGFTDRTPGELEFARAVAAWQLREGMLPDGQLGPSSWKRLSSQLSGSAQEIDPMRGAFGESLSAQVAQFQRQLGLVG